MPPALATLPNPTRAPAPLIVSALFLSESIEGLDEGAGFLDALPPADVARLRAAGRSLTLRPGQSVFRQGEPHSGIFLIETGRVRVFYTGPSGRQSRWPIGRRGTSSAVRA